MIESESVTVLGPTDRSPPPPQMGNPPTQPKPPCALLSATVVFVTTSVEP